MARPRTARFRARALKGARTGRPRLIFEAGCLVRSAPGPGTADGRGGAGYGRRAGGGGGARERKGERGGGGGGAAAPPREGPPRAAGPARPERGRAARSFFK